MLLGYVNVKAKKPFADKSILMEALLTGLTELIFKKPLELLDTYFILKGLGLGQIWDGDLHQKGFTAYLIPFTLPPSERFLNIYRKKTLSFFQMIEILSSNSVNRLEPWAPAALTANTTICSFNKTGG